MSEAHLPFIVAAYAVAAITVAAMIALILLDRRSLTRKLSRLSERSEALRAPRVER